MLVLKSLDIDLIQSEKKTLFGFFTLYLLLCLLILFFIGILQFNSEKDLMLEKKRVFLEEYTNDFIFRLKDLHVNIDKYKFYPRDEKFKSAIFDSDKKLIFSTIEDTSTIFLNKIIYTTHNSKIQFIKSPESYYLGAKYIVIQIDDDESWVEDIEKSVLSIFAILFFIMMLIGYFLLDILLKPMKDALYLLDRFIKDTTHELNTPVSAIVSNIEMIDIEKLQDEKLARKIRRIDIGAKTVSNIYEDLTYLTLNNKIISQNENIDLSLMLMQRVEYFQTLANVKKIEFILEIEEKVYLHIDRKKISKLIDNLFSNAIKYNKVGGTIKVILKDDHFSIEDTGKGMSSKQLKSLFVRYKRFDKSVGGFGIGLNIVSLIAKEYNLKVNVSSTLNIGTKIEVKWQN